jgi:hypothetical protein
MRGYTKADVDQIFDALRELVTVNSPDPEDYSFRMDALIRFWLFEMQHEVADPEHVWEALQQAMVWAGWQAVIHTDSGTVH